MIFTPPDITIEKMIQCWVNTAENSSKDLKKTIKKRFVNERSLGRKVVWRSDKEGNLYGEKTNKCKYGSTEENNLKIRSTASIIKTLMKKQGNKSFTSY